MKGKYSSYLFEVAWILPSFAVPLSLLVAILITAFAVGIRVPDIGGRVDPATLTTTAPFDQPGLKEIAPGRYEAVIVAQLFSFTTGEKDEKGVGVLRVPVGSKVSFIVSSKDVIHGFKIDRTPINVMVLPGQISRVTATFNEAGTYLIYCHEYCGNAHHTMYGKVIVE